MEKELKILMLEDLEDDAVLMYFLGLTQYKLKQRPESRQSLQRALDLHLRADLAVEARKILAELK